MTKKEKIKSLATALTQSERDGEENFYHFTDDAPEELKDEFLKHYNVDDLDYEMFSRAADIVAEVYEDKPKATDDEATDDIYERASESASIMTYDRLQYLNNNTEGEISDIMHEYSERSIATACAIWYDKQVEEMAIIIKDWVNA